MTWAIDVGGDEAQKIAARIQENEVAQNGEATGPATGQDPHSVVTDAEANQMVAELHAGLMGVIAMARGDHWRADDEEKATVRDLVAPSVVELVPNRLLAKSRHLTAIVAYSQIITRKLKDEQRH